MRLGQGMLAAASVGGTNHSNSNSSGNRSSSGNKHHTHTDAGEGHEGSNSSSNHHNSRSHNQSDAGAVPAEFLCAINGHVMKAPLRCRESGLVFEKATIELWLTSRGSVCPITVITTPPHPLTTHPNTHLVHTILHNH